MKRREPPEGLVLNSAAQMVLAANPAILESNVVLAVVVLVLAAESGYLDS